MAVGEQLSRQRVEPADPLDGVAPPLDPIAGLLVAREDLERVALDTEGATRAAHVVPLVLDVDEPLHRELERELGAPHGSQELPLVLLGGAEPVDARDAGHDQDVATGKQRGGGRVPQPLDLVVHRRVLLDVRVRLRDVGLGLVVVVIAHEVLDRVVGEDLPELVGELRAERLVGRDHQGRTLDPFDQVGDRERLPGPGGPEERDLLLPRLDALDQLFDGVRLVPGRTELGGDLEGGHAHASLGPSWRQASFIRGLAHIRPAAMIRSRNGRVASSRGAVNICSGGPSSRIRPCIEERDPVRHVAGEAHLVGRDHHRHARGWPARGSRPAPRPPGPGRARSSPRPAASGRDPSRARARWRRVAAALRRAGRDSRRPCPRSPNRASSSVAFARASARLDDRAPSPARA